mmetsp:Transcript_101066/g.281497  ORF Transcript_101066/g.281497 Transcript_101066/m.281497 type:complete len:203 (-) Transcript_101066:138-746(-)
MPLPMMTKDHQCTSERYLMKRNFQRICTFLSWNHCGATITVRQKRPPKPKIQNSTAMIPMTSMPCHSGLSKQIMLRSESKVRVPLGLGPHLNSFIAISAMPRKNVKMREKKPLAVRFASMASSGLFSSFPSACDAPHTPRKMTATMSGPRVFTMRLLWKEAKPAHCGLKTVDTSLLKLNASMKLATFTGKCMLTPPRITTIW